jgi:hypothetical protein
MNKILMRCVGAEEMARTRGRLTLQKIADQPTATRADRLMILVPIRFDCCFHLYSRVANQKLIEPLTATEKNGTGTVSICTTTKRTCTLTFPRVDYHDADLRLRNH